MIRIEQLSVAYGEKLVIKELKAEFSNRQIYGVLGINGAGKTTLFNTIYGAKSAQEGQVTLMGKPITKQDIAYLQTENYFYPLMKGKEYLQLVAPKQSYDSWNEIFRLPLEEFVENYSTGMKKKLAFLGLILLNREVYILDEPFNGVDIQSNEILLLIIQSLKEKGKYIFISSHMLTSLLQVSDYIYRLQDGRFDQIVDRQDFAQFKEDFQAEISKEVTKKLKNLNF